MCIIITKAAGVALPEQRVLKRCYESNPDGAGLAWQDARTGQIHLHKGFMTFSAFIKTHRRLAKAYDLTACNVIYHFRIATAGDVLPGLTHPFPVTASISDLIAPRLTPRLAVAHNGHISNTAADAYSYYSRYGYGGYTRPGGAADDVSDTAAFIRDELAALAKDFPRFYESPALLALIQARVTSKLAFLTPSGIYRTGAFVHDEPTGLYFSNGGYKPAPARPAYRVSGSYFDRGDLASDDGPTWTTPTPYSPDWRDNWQANGGRPAVNSDTVSDDAALVQAYLDREGGVS